MADIGGKHDQCDELRRLISSVLVEREGDQHKKRRHESADLHPMKQQEVMLAERQPKHRKRQDETN